MTFIELLEKHKLVRRLILVWAMAVITWVIVRVFGPVPPDISAGTATALATVVGILGTAIGLYKWLRGREDGKNKHDDETERK